MAKFIERYLVRFEDPDAMEPVSAGRFPAAWRRVAREFGLESPWLRPTGLWYGYQTLWAVV